MKRVAAALLLLTTSLTSAGWEDKLLTGSYNIAGKTIIDPPDTEARGTHMYFALSGASAQDLYNSMKARAIPDTCRGGGDIAKSIGGMRCVRSANGREFQCWFAIDIARQRITEGVVC
jgi:hypothetical protein